MPKSERGPSVSITGAIAFLVGMAVMLGGAFMAFKTLGNTSQSLEWGVVAFLGMFPLVYGVSKLLFGGSGGREERGTPPGKT